MAGHSQFKNIMHRKGAAGRGAVEAVLQARARNHRRRQARHARPDDELAPAPARSQNARAENMPKDNIERAIKKALGRRRRELRRDPLRGLRPGRRRRHRRGADRQPQPHRLATSARYFTKSGGALGETGSVSFMFDRVGEIDYDASVGSADEVMEAAIEAGADDVIATRTATTIYRLAGDLRRGRQGAGGEARRAAKAKSIWKPQNTMPVDDETGEIADEADRSARGRRRRAERLRQFRGLRRADGQDGRPERAFYILMWAVFAFCCFFLTSSRDVDHFHHACVLLS